MQRKRCSSEESLSPKRQKIDGDGVTERLPALSSTHSASSVSVTSDNLRAHDVLLHSSKSSAPTQVISLPKDESEPSESDTESSLSSVDFEGEVFGCWEAMGKISSGNNGQVYVARLEDKQIDVRVALKVETRSKRSHLMTEVRCMREFQNEPGFPRALDDGVAHCRRWMTMDLLGPSLRNLYERYKFDDDIILFLANQMLTRLEALHRHEYVHLSIKPDNFCLNLDASGELTVFLIDFGRCEHYIDQETGKHIEYGDNRGGPFSRWYHSAGALQGKRQSRRDDMISLAYTFVYFYKGEKFIDWREELPEPWVVDVADHFQGKLPVWVLTILKHVTQLQWTEAPDYAMIRKLIYSRLTPEGTNSAIDFLSYAVRRHFQKMKL